MSKVKTNPKRFDGFEEVVRTLYTGIQACKGAHCLHIGEVRG